MISNIKCGICLGVVLVVVTQILTWLGLGLTNWFVGLTYLSVIIFIAVSLRNQKKLNEGKLSFLQAISSIFVIILVSRVIFQLYMFIYTNYIDPQWVDMTAENWTQKMKETGLTAEKIDQSITSFRKSYETLPMFSSTLVLYAIPQFILGLIVSLFYVFLGNKK